MAEPEPQPPVRRRPENTRTRAMFEAIKVLLQSKSQELDQAQDLAEVTIKLSFKAGSCWVQGTEWSERRVGHRWQP